MFNSGNETALPELIQYISRKKNIETIEAEKQLNESCNNWLSQLKNDEVIMLGTLGTLYRDQDNILFNPQQVNFFKPIETGGIKEEPINEVVLMPSIEKSKTENIQGEIIYDEPIEDRSYWGMWALILVAIISVTLFFHFFDQGFSIKSVGNQNQVKPDSSGPAYIISK